MYIINEKKEKIKIDDVDTVEHFVVGGKQYDEFGVATFVICLIILIIVGYLWYNSGGEEVASVDIEPSSSMSSSMKSESAGSLGEMKSSDVGSRLSMSEASAIGGPRKKSGSLGAKKKSGRK